MTQPTTASPREAAGSVLALGIKAATAYDRPELAARLQRRADRLASANVRVVVIGEFKAGKSTLINALLGTDACPTDDDVATAVPTLVRQGAGPAAFGVTLTDTGAERSPFPYDTRDTKIREDGDDELGFTAVELDLPGADLLRGLELMDTPGVGGLRSGHTAAAIASLDDAEAAIFVTEAAKELSSAEIAVLRQVAQRCPNVLVVMTKCDIYPHWSDILDIDERHLERAGLDIPIFPVSSRLRELALEHRDAELNRESGFDRIIALVRDDISAQADVLAIDQVVHELDTAIGSIVEAFETELTVLSDPAEAARIEAELEEAARRAEELKTHAARWQTTLNDGVNDLMTEIDHDLRGRIRSISAEATERISELDPHQSWDEFQTWFEQQVTDQLLANAMLLSDRTDELVGQVMDHFRIEGELVGSAPGVLLSAETAPSERTLDELDLDRATPIKQVLGALRGSYSGLMMFGMLGGMAGVAMATPVLAGIGLFLGARQVKDEKERQLKAHRQQAQQTVRKFMDDVTFVATKSSRDQIKRVQRGLRDHYSAQSSELQERVTHVLAGVRAATGTADRDKRARDLEAELKRLQALQERVDTLCD